MFSRGEWYEGRVVGRESGSRGGCIVGEGV